LVIEFGNFSLKRCLQIHALINFGWVIQIVKNTHPNQSPSLLILKSIATN